MRDYVTPENLRIPFENIFFDSQRRKIVGWFIPSTIANNPKTIIVCHGWGASKGDVLPSTIFLRESFNLLYFDFTNHGESNGDKSSMSRFEAEDLFSAITFLESVKPEYSRKIGVLGFSMGGAIAIYAASKDKRISAVVSESPFDSFNNVIYHYAKLFFKLPPHPLVDITILAAIVRLEFSPENYSPIHHVSDVAPTPLLLIAGGKDKNIPLEMVKRVFDKARQPKQLYVFDTAEHGMAYQEDPQEYKKIVLNFFNKTL